MSLSSPRIAPIALDQLTDEQAALGGGRDNLRCQLNFVRTLVQHPALYGTWIPFAEQLIFRSSLPPKHREMLIIRTSQLCGERYEIAHHLYIARTLGLTDAEIDATKRGSNELADFELTLLKAAEELVTNHCVADATWATLAEQYTTQQLMEVVFVVANYSLIAMVTNSFGIHSETDVAGAWKPF
jgi:alkylhydroperoxidase family enzyme